MRKMASIQRILSLTAIPGADKIETARVQGWDVVVKKDEYKVGELVVYCEIDSWIPNSVASFLTKEGHEPKEYEGIKGERLRTVKLKKQISQGLILPIHEFPKLVVHLMNFEEKEGTDVSEILGILKWEAPEEKGSNNGTSAQANKTRAFPYFLRKTDQERIQNYSHLIEAELDTEFEISIKKDGSSCTVFRVDPSSEYYEDAKAMLQGKLTLWQKIKNYVFRKKPEAVFGICSRNVLLKTEGDSNFHKATKEALFVLQDERLEGKSYAIQGEVVAPDIQGNYEKVDGVEYHIFDIFNIDKQQYVTPVVRSDFIFDAWPDLSNATVIAYGTLRDIIDYKEGDDIVAEVLAFAEGKSDNPSVMREGVVFKAMTKDFSFKAISNSYLLHKG